MFFFSKFFKKKPENLDKEKGTTLVELAISLAIFAVITAVVMFNYADFNSNIVMTNLAYETGLFIREAQVYGTAVAGISGEFGISAEFSDAYGVFVEQNQPSILIYRDTIDPDLGFYDGSISCVTSDAECMEKITFSRGVLVKSVSVIKNESSHSLGPLETLHISFKRPDPSAVIQIPGYCDRNNLPLCSRATLTLESPTGRQRQISIFNTGQISISVPESQQ